jgi:tRNA pseudouridine55 synthase
VKPASRSGILSVEKGQGVTSFQVVAYLRRLLRASKVGHGGTLDPDASGVLPILIGEATKLTPYLVDLDKEYLATVRLGIVTDTQDVSGTILATRPVPELGREEIAARLAPFVGEITQVPPMYSALHHEGKRLYELARAGVEVERAPRRITVHAITIESVELPSFTLRVRCGKGTYVRTLAADIGETFACGAALARLIRTRVGPFTLEASVPWSELRDCRDGSTLWERLLPPDRSLEGVPAVRLEMSQLEAFGHGRSVPWRESPEGLVRVYGPDGRFHGLGLGRAGVVKPERLLHADPPRPRVLPA